MNEIVFYQQQLLASLSDKERYLTKEIDWSNRLIGIKGARGSGKTTLLLQRIKFHLEKEDEAVYASMDNLYFLENTLVDFVKEFVLNGGTHLFLDEVHKYPTWSRELKLVYDLFPNLHIVFTSSSILEIYKGESDLSRRAVSYFLKEMSFREYIYFTSGQQLPKLTIEEIIKNHKEIASQVKTNIQTPVKEFKSYLETGAYPFFLENRKGYKQKLLKTLNLILEVDLNTTENITYSDSLKIKKLLIAIAQSAPFTPNISGLSNKLHVSREFLLNALKLLERASLVMALYSPTKGVGALTKPEKLYLNNANWVYALGKTEAQIGTARETFFANQFQHLYEIHLAEKGDFLINKTHTFEIGGKGKQKKQIQSIPNSYIVRDDIEVGGLNIIPLYLFGLLY